MYLRRNIVKTIDPDSAGTATPVQLWQYEEAVLTRDEYAQYKAEIDSASQQQIMERLRMTATDESLLIIMGAIADLYEQAMT